MTGGARRIGVIGNPRSHAYRAGPWNARAAHPGLAVAEPDGMPALRDALSRFAAESIDLLIVQGGDGTLRDVLSLLPDAYPDRPPELAILATGNTNLAARIFGRVGSGPRGLDRFVAAAQAGRLCRSTCRTLRVAWRGAPDRPPLRGLFLGAGIYADGKRIADAEIHRRGVHYGPAVGLAAALALLRVLADRGGTLRAGTVRRIAMPGRPEREGACFVFLATTLHRLMLGVWPFPVAGADQGAIHWLDIDAPPRRLAATLLAMLLRRHGGAGPGHHGGLASEIRLCLSGPFVLDGEFFDPGPGGVVLSDGGAVTIVRP
jgi:hypothetical protein